MPRTRSVAFSELKLGLVGVFAIVLVVLLIVAVGGQGGFPWQTYPLKTRFDDAQGLKTGAVVRLSGKDVGKVTSVEFEGAQIEVEMTVSKRVRPLITTKSTASVGSLSLLGESIITVSAGPGGTPIADWGYITSSAKAGGPLGEIAGKASAGLEQATAVFSDLRAGRGTLGKLMTDQALYDELEQFVAAAGQVAKALQSGKGTIGQLTNDPAAYNALKASLDNLNAITTKMNSGQGSLSRLLNDDAIAKSLAASSSNLEQMTGNLNRGEGTAGKLMTDREIYDRLNSLTTKLDAVAAGLEAGRGTVGLLLRDQRLYENMNMAATEIRNLVADIRKDPKKFLRVTVSIF